MPAKTPKWLTLGPENVTITLSHPVELNGVKQNRITLRTPTFGDLRAARKRGNDDANEQDAFLFSMIADCAPSDIDRLSIKDFYRLQEGYFRLIREDDDSGTQAPVQAAGD